jgi:hypothetical protein
MVVDVFMICGYVKCLKISFCRAFYYISFCIILTTMAWAYQVIRFRIDFTPLVGTFYPECEIFIRVDFVQDYGKGQ